MSERERQPDPITQRPFDFELRVLEQETGKVSFIMGNDDEGIDSTIDELIASNPHCGREVLLTTDEEMLVLRYGGHGREVSKLIVPTPHEPYRLVGGHLVTGDEAPPTLGLTFEIPGQDDCLGFIDAIALRKIKLADTTNPFKYELGLLREAIKRWPSVEQQLPFADKYEYLDEVAKKIENLSLLMHADVELLFVEETQALVDHSLYVPGWIDDKADGRDLSERDIYGTVRGKILEICSKKHHLLTVVELAPDDALVAEDPEAVSVLVAVDDISWGRVISGPSFN